MSLPTNRLLVACGLSAILLTGCDEPPDLRTFSEGDRTGVVTKFSYRSTYEPPTIEPGCTNWEGEIAMANSKFNTTVSTDSYNGVSSSSTSTSGGNTFEFSLPKSSDNNTYATNADDVVNAIKEAQRSGHRILLHYNQVAHRNECSSRTDYLIVGIQDLDRPNQPVLAGRINQRSP